MPIASGNLTDKQEPGIPIAQSLMQLNQGSNMKVMTCRELGGPCDQQLSASSWDEMVKTMTKHVMDNHPDTAREMSKMHNEDPKKWGREMKPKWDAKPEV